MANTKTVAEEANVDVAEQKAVETEPTQTESPQVEKPITGAETDVKVSDDQGTVTENLNEPTFQSEEQRRAFQDMRLENKRLKEEMETRKTSESAFKVFRTQTPPASQPVRVESYQDPITGETNWTAYNQAQQAFNQQIVQQARAEAQAAAQELIDEQNARVKYPDLMNDPVTEKQIASRWLYEKVQGNNVSITDIAGEFARNFKLAVSKAEKIGAEKALNEVSEKEQAGLVAETQTSQPARAGESEEELGRLSARTRGGDDEAITARVSRIPWANK